MYAERTVPARFKRGQHVVVRGLGLGAVVSEGARGLRIRVGDGRDATVVTLEPDQIDERVRTPLGPAEAVAALEASSRARSRSDRRPWLSIEADLRDLLIAGTPREQLVQLRWLYAQRDRTPPQERLIELFERALVPELAHALDRTAAQMRKRIRGDHAAMGTTAPERATAPIEPLRRVPRGWRVGGAFRGFSGRLVVGERFQREGDARSVGGVSANLVVPCRCGEWFALVREDDDGPEYTLATRAVVASLSARLRASKTIGYVAVEGGTVPVIDEEVRGDRDYEKKVRYDVSLDRGFIASVGGDGPTAIAAWRPSARKPFELLHVAP